MAIKSNPLMDLYRNTPLGRATDLNARNSYLSLALHPERQKDYNQFNPAEATKAIADAFNPLTYPQVRDPVGSTAATFEMFNMFAGMAANIWTGGK